jgi:hypothetical protein
LPAAAAAAVLCAGVRLADGRVFRGKTIISNATRWDTFEGMIGGPQMPESEKLFRWVPGVYNSYKFYSIPGLFGRA